MLRVDVDIAASLVAGSSLLVSGRLVQDVDDVEMFDEELEDEWTSPSQNNNRPMNVRQPPLKVRAELQRPYGPVQSINAGISCFGEG